MAELFNFLDIITISIEAQILIVLVVGSIICLFRYNFSKGIKRAKYNIETFFAFLNDLLSKKKVDLQEDNKKWVTDLPSTLSDSFFSFIIGFQALFVFVFSLRAGFNGEKSKFLLGMIFSILLTTASRYFFVRSAEVYDVLKNESDRNG